MTPELAKQQGYKYNGWEVGIRRTKDGLKDVRIVISGLAPDIMREEKDYHNTLITLVNQAKQILYKPPYPNYITQGVIKCMENNIQFISKDELRKEK